MTSRASTRTWSADRASGVEGIDKIARVGYIAKGVVYAIVGWLAVQAAFSGGGQTTGAEGALQQIVSESYGQFLLILVAIGLAAYAFWRFVQAIADPENKGSDLKGLARRAGYFASGLIHGFLVITAGRIVAGGSSGQGGQNGAESLSAKLMSESHGQWLVAAIGVGVIAAGIHNLVKGYKESFRKELALSRMSAEARKWAVRSGKIGLMARGVVFWIIGGFFIIAAYRADPNQAKGLGEALRTLEQQPYGPYLLGAVGIGLVGYAVHQFVNARYRMIPPP